MPNNYPASFAFLDREYGGLYRTESAVVTVSTTPQPAAGGNAERISLTFCNTGSVAAFVTLDAEAPNGSGILLPPGGGAVSMTVRDDGSSVTLPWYVVSSGATTIYVVQSLRYGVTGG